MDTRRPHRQGAASGRHGAHLRACGLSDTAHALRHRFATQVYERTADIHLVAELLGHSSIETTRIYAAVSPSRRAAAVALIA